MGCVVEASRAVAYYLYVPEKPKFSRSGPLPGLLIWGLGLKAPKL